MQRFTLFMLVSGLTTVACTGIWEYRAELLSEFVIDNKLTMAGTGNWIGSGWFVDNIGRVLYYGTGALGFGISYGIARL